MTTSTKKSGKAKAGEVRDIAKSLHTISVLKQVATVYLLQGNRLDRAMQLAMVTLELAGRPDPYGLEATATKQLKAQAEGSSK